MALLENVPVDAVRHPLEFTILASAQRSAETYNSDDIINPGFRGFALFIDVTAETGTSTIDVKLQYKDPVSGSYVDLTGGSLAQITDTGTFMLLVYPGAGDGDAGTDNLVVSAPLPRIFRVVHTVGGTDFTFSSGGVMLP